MYVCEGEGGIGSKPKTSMEISHFSATHFL